MPTKLLATAMLFCSVAYGATGTKSVGTASVRGNIRVDGNQITTDATLFDGSTVETTAVSATLYIDTHSVIMMDTGTRSIVHENYVKLEQGKIDVKPVCGFVVEVDRVRVTPNSTTAHGVIYISNSSVSVMALHGEFLVLDDHGRVLSELHSGSSKSFGTGEVEPLAQAIHVGNLSILDHHHLLTSFAPDTDVTYELQGRHADRIQGKLMQIHGAVDPQRHSVLSQVGEVISATRGTEMCTEKPLYPWIIGAAAAAGTAAGFAIVNQPPSPASK
jgi:hypothetical protein